MAAAAVAGGPSPRNFTHYATQALTELQSRFWNGAGWNDSMWWQEANTLETLSNLAMAEPQVLPAHKAACEAIFNATSNATVGRCDWYCRRFCVRLNRPSKNWTIHLPLPSLAMRTMTSRCTF